MCNNAFKSSGEDGIINVISEKLEIENPAAPFGSANVECKAIITGKKCLNRC